MINGRVTATTLATTIPIRRKGHPSREKQTENCSCRGFTRGYQRGGRGGGGGGDWRGGWIDGRSGGRSENDDVGGACREEEGGGLEKGG